MVQSGTYTSHPAAFFDQPFAAPHQSAGSEVPSDSFPPGEAKWCKPLACTLYYNPYEKLLPFNEQLNCARFRADAIRPYSAFLRSPSSVIVRRHRRLPNVFLAIFQNSGYNNIIIANRSAL